MDHVQVALRYVLLTVLAAVLVGWVVSDAASTIRGGSAGDLIAFERRVGGGAARTDIYLMKTDGSAVRKLVRGCCFDWSPDGKVIAYIGADERLGVINVDGSGQRPLAGDFTAHDLDWAPARRIVFSAGKDYELHVVNADGTGLRRLTRPQHIDLGPRWSPNGRRIAFERHLEENGSNGTDIYVVDADGTGLRRLTHGLGHERPSWAPGGRRIAFSGWDGDYALFVMNDDGSEQQELARTFVHESKPTWSPSGRRIAFTAGRYADVHVISPSGRRHRNLTRSRGLDSEQSWSRDGQQIAFVSTRDGNSDIYVMRATGREPTNLTNSPKGTMNRSPAWSPSPGG
jgi:TolB protein